MHTGISLGTKCQLKLTILIFWTKSAKKMCFQFQTEKVKITTEFYIFELVLVPNFNVNCIFWLFVPSLPKRVFTVKNRKSEHHHWILHIWFCLVTKFEIKLISLIFLTKFAQKGNFWSKTQNSHFCGRP